MKQLFGCVIIKIIKYFYIALLLEVGVHLYLKLFPIMLNMKNLKKTFYLLNETFSDHLINIIINLY